MVTVNIHDAKTHLSALLGKVERGETVVIARNGKPVACLSAAPPQRKTRKPGSAKGQIWMADDFDAPLPDDILKGFTG